MTLSHRPVGFQGHTQQIPASIKPLNSPSALVCPKSPCSSVNTTDQGSVGPLGLHSGEKADTRGTYRDGDSKRFSNSTAGIPTSSISGHQLYSHTQRQTVSHAVTCTSFAHSLSVTVDKDSDLMVPLLHPLPYTASIRLARGCLIGRLCPLDPIDTLGLT